MEIKIRIHVRLETDKKAQRVYEAKRNVDFTVEDLTALWENLTGIDGHRPSHFELHANGLEIRLFDTNVYKEQVKGKDEFMYNCSVTTAFPTGTHGVVYSPHAMPWCSESVDTWLARNKELRDTTTFLKFVNARKYNFIRMLLDRKRLDVLYNERMRQFDTDHSNVMARVDHLWAEKQKEQAKENAEYEEQFNKVCEDLVDAGYYMVSDTRGE